MKIYIGNFSYEVTEQDLNTAFEPYGQIELIKIIKDKFTGQSKGFGFVDMPNKVEAEAAIKGLTEIQGKRITINEARPLVKSSFGFQGRDNRRSSGGFRKERRY